MINFSFPNKRKEQYGRAKLSKDQRRKLDDQNLIQENDQHYSPANSEDSEDDEEDC